MLRVLPGSRRPEVGRRQQSFNCSGREFVTVLGMNSFARVKVDGKGRAAGVCGNVDTLIRARFKMHLDAGFSGIPEHFVAEVLRVEVGAKVAVQARENIQVEGGGSSSSIIVGSQQA